VVLKQLGSLQWEALLWEARPWVARPWVGLRAAPRDLSVPQLEAAQDLES
jgi:hypothetical protein